MPAFPDDKMVQVGIGAVDLTGPAFASAAAQAQAFQTKVAATTGSFTEARGAAKLFSEESGVGLNRELLRAVASSKLLQGALSAALPVGLAVGFAVVAVEGFKKLYEEISGIKELEKSVAAGTEWIKHAQEVFKQYEAINRETQLIGKTAEDQALMKRRWAAEDLGAQQAYLTQLKAEVDVLNAQDAVKNKQIGTAFGRGAGTGTPVVADIGGISNEQNERRVALTKQIHDIELQISLDKAKAGKASVEYAQNEVESAQKARDAWLAAMDAAGRASGRLLGKGTSEDNQINLLNEQLSVWEKIRQSNYGINAIANDFIEKLQKQVDLTKAQEAAEIHMSLLAAGRRSFSDTVTAGGSNPVFTGSSQAMDLYKVQTDMNVAWTQAREIIDSLQTPLQTYNATLDAMNELLFQGKISVAQFDAAAAKAGEGLNNSGFGKYYQELGKEIDKTVLQAALFQESWSKAFRSLLDDVVKLVLQMYVFKEIASSFGFVSGVAGSGGFWGQLFGGMAGGRAGGGGVSSGMSYLVGERGPEIFTPGASGSITPNNRLGAGTVNYNIDARGADAGVEQRVRAAIAASENRAVSRSMAAAADQRARR